MKKNIARLFFIKKNFLINFNKDFLHLFDFKLKIISSVLFSVIYLPMGTNIMSNLN